jgi:hypothetical protein
MNLLATKRATMIVALSLLALIVHATTQSASNAKAQANEGAAVAGVGELLYAPIYSSVFYDDGARTLEMASTLYVHNVDPDRPITLIRADYYDTDGKLIKKYVNKPTAMGPLKTLHFVIEKANVAGGTGANFIVEWRSEQDGPSPLVESVTVNAKSNLGIGFTSPARLIRRLGPAAK